MALTKYKLGQLLELCDERNSEGKYTLDDVKGISIQKCFIETKANMENVSLSPYILVKPDYFVYVTVTSRNGEKITIAHNTSNCTYIVSSSYVVFKVKRTDLLMSDYLFMYFNRRNLTAMLVSILGALQGKLLIGIRCVILILNCRTLLFSKSMLIYTKQWLPISKAMSVGWKI